MAMVDLQVDGEVDVATAPRLKQELSTAIEANPGATIVVDLSNVDFLDSSGLGVLVGSLRRARETDGTIVLRGPRPNVAKVFQITGLDKVFDIVPA